MKKKISLLCFVFLLLSVFLIACASDEASQNTDESSQLSDEASQSSDEESDPSDDTAHASLGLAYKINPDRKSCTIMGLGSCKKSKINIPAKMNGYPVTAIGDEAFRYCESLTSVSIPDSVTHIGDEAFGGCTGLTGTSYDNGIYLGNENNPYIYLWKANYQNVSSVTIHEDTKIIGNDVGWKCNQLTSLMIPDGVTSIGRSAFCNCENLESISIPDSVVFIGQYAFSAHKRSASTSYDNGIYLGNASNPYVYLQAKSSSMISSITIHENTKIICGGVFRDCLELKSITIGKSVRHIGNEAFSNCIKVTDITIPDSVVFIGKKAFSGLSNLQSLKLGSSVNFIGSQAFAECTKLESVTIPGCVTEIDNFAFDGCEKLTNVTIEDGVLSINDRVFQSCASLKNVTIPDSIMHIGEGAFAGCSSISSTYSYDNGLYLGNPGNPYVYLHRASNQNISSITLYESTRFVGFYAFSDCTKLTSVILPNAVVSIDSCAFRDCTALTSITIPDNVTFIGGAAFYNCTSLKSVSIPDSVTSIDSQAFDNCTSLKGTAYNNGIYLGNEDHPYLYFWKESSSNTSPLTLHESTKIIGDYVISPWTETQSILIPQSVIFINYDAFQDAMWLRFIYYSGTKHDWNEHFPNFSTSYVYFYSETQPSTTGKYWHYVDGVPTKWETP